MRLDGGRCLRNHRRNIELREKWLISTVLWLNYSREQHLEKLSLKVSSFCQEILKNASLCHIPESVHVSCHTHSSVNTLQSAQSQATAKSTCLRAYTVTPKRCVTELFDFVYSYSIVSGQKVIYVSAYRLLSACERHHPVADRPIADSRPML